MSTKAMTWAAVGGLAALAVLLVLQKKNLLVGVAAGAVGAAADTGAGLALGVGDLLGVPRTDADKCRAAKAAGSLWEQSLYCPAVDFTSSLLSSAAAPVANAVQSAGELLGIPRTDETECQRALREGRTWDASFACPAGTFISHTFGL